MLRHRYAEAARMFDRALQLAPDFHSAEIGKGWTYVLWRGELDTLRAVLSRIPADADFGGTFGSRSAVQLQLFMWGRQPDSMLQVLVTERARVFEDQGDFVPSALYAAWAHQLRGDRPAARAAFDSARVFLDSVVRERPDAWSVHAARGLALAGLDRRADALLEARWLQQSPRYHDDAIDGAAVAENRAQILAQVGDAGAALGDLERVLSQPSVVSMHKLQLDPRWDPIRNDPRFQALLKKYGG
jgi:serine/threonine-protein kinase